MTNTDSALAGPLSPGELSPDGWYRWDGVAWVDRRVYFGRQIAAVQAKGYSLIAQDDRMAKLRRNQKPALPVVAHLLLTVFTLGLWLLVWVPVAVIDSLRSHEGDFVTLEV